MTKKEIKQYEELDIMFNDDCERVVKILKNYVVYTEKHENSDIRYAEKFSISGEDVEWEGDEYWSYGGHEYHSGCFPLKYISMSDEEIKIEAEKENKKYLEKITEKSAERKRKEEEAKYNEYLKLKEKYEGK